MSSLPAGAITYRGLENALGGYVSRVSARAVLGVALKRSGLREGDVRPGEASAKLLQLIERGVALYCDNPVTRERCIADVRLLLGRQQGEDLAPVTVEVEVEADVVRARGQARAVAALLGFQHTEQIKIATAVSELARNIHRYAGKGTIQLVPETGARRALVIRSEDRGPGIDNLEEILEGRYQSKTGMGLGLLGCKRLMDEFEIQTDPGQGTRIEARKILRS